MSWKNIAWAFIVWTVTANTAVAGVRINEIAWMGTTESANDEWMELENNGDTSIDLTGWHLVAESGAPAIALEGTIAPKGYFLLERTSDATVSYVVANQIYTGALSNSGTTLTLTDSIGNTVDQVVGGANWINVGGDNATKDTAQRTRTSWETASPTPSALNVGGGEVLGASTTGGQGGGTETSVATSSTATSGAGTGGSSGIKSPYPRKNITVFAGDDKVAFVDFPVVFSGRALGLYDESFNYGTYRWNFGDGATAEGESVTHKYHFTGEYLVTLEVFRGESKNTDRLAVVVTNPTVLISKVVVGDGGFVELINHSSREIDLSRWRLEGSMKENIFILPPHTVLLPGKTLVLPNTITKQGLGDGGLELTSPDGVVVHSWNLISAAISKEANTVNNFVAKKTPTINGEAAQVSQAVESYVATTGEYVIWGASASMGDHQGNLSSRILEEKKWIIVLATILLALVAGFIVMRSQVEDEESVEEKYRIIEDIIEGDEEGQQGTKR